MIIQRGFWQSLLLGRGFRPAWQGDWTGPFPLDRAPGFFLGAAVLLAAGLLVSCGTLNRSVLMPPEIEGATFLGNQACSLC